MADTERTRRGALVTGAASGIGRGAAVALAQHGFDVAINYSTNDAGARETAAAVEHAGGTAVVVKCDVADDAAVRQMMARVGEAFGGRLDALINNAGTTVPNGPNDWEGVSPEAWDRVFAVNVRGLWQVTRAAIPLLRQADEPAIVNTCSIAGLRPGPQPFPYAASKAAVANMTKTFAAALGPKVRVNAVAPGWLAGDWMERTLGENYAGLMARRAKYTPLKRCVTVEDVAETMVNLILSNRFVTGEIIIIDGGFASST
ncbi:MAG: SDR family oxidoreductase [Chloroflexi bacterium]|nr:SDR family oxidoreductase [Chloroflexota bacterium]